MRRRFSVEGRKKVVNAFEIRDIARQLSNLFSSCAAGREEAEAFRERLGGLVEAVGDDVHAGTRGDYLLHLPQGVGPIGIDEGISRLTLAMPPVFLRNQEEARIQFETRRQKTNR